MGKYFILLVCIIVAAIVLYQHRPLSKSEIEQCKSVCQFDPNDNGLSRAAQRGKIEHTIDRLKVEIKMFDTQKIFAGVNEITRSKRGAKAERESCEKTLKSLQEELEIALILANRF